MSICLWRERFLLEGWMPERALLRLRRAGISLYDIQKIAQNRILFSIKRRDKEKVLTLYPQNKVETTAYRVKYLHPEGFGRYVSFMQRRVGLLIGGLLCIALLLASQPLVFTVDIIGDECYRRDVLQALDEAGIQRFAPYKKGQEDLVCAKLLAMDGVEYCAMKKTGNRLAVEIRLSSFPKVKTETGKMQAKHDGTVLSMTVLRGSPQKQIGDTVRKGETLVEDHFITEDGGQVRVEIIARVCLACTWEGEIEANSEEEAFAKAYLTVNFTEQDTLQKTTIKNNGKTYRVTMQFQAVETINLWQE